MSKYQLRLEFSFSYPSHMQSNYSRHLELIVTLKKKKYIPVLPSCSVILERSDPPTMPTVTTYIPTRI